MSSKFWAKLSSDYEKLFETELGYDVIIYAGEEPNVKEIHAHSNILCIRSQYFNIAFSNEWAEKRMESLFSKNQILHHNYLTSFLGNVINLNNFIFLEKNISNYLTISDLFIV